MCVLLGMALVAPWAMAPAIVRQLAEPDRTSAYFFDVGQGDSSALMLAANGTAAVFMIDAGPKNGKAAGALDGIMPPFRRRIDVLFLTHPNLDHYGGVKEVVGRYDVGLVATNGRSADGPEWEGTIDAIRRARIPIIALGAGDMVAFGSSAMNIVSPTPEFRDGPADNDSSLVVRADTPGMSLLFTGDIGPAAERFLRDRIGHADVLKVPHHGSRFSSTADFLATVSPRIGVIEVGRNSYGHPTDDALHRLAAADIRTYRTDIDGTVTVTVNGGVMRVYKTK
ncbi:MAG: MBL fold metallo-hydrolase [Candidatus Liptonbacteria bacterium]|nr:MBL fold metallo-hydrolase [Candidatus Liptonbacteria bacterium]